MKNKIIIIVLLLLMAMPKSGYAASNPYPKTQKFNGVVSTPCTRVAWQEVYDRLGIALPGWGNAVNWYKNAADDGYQVGSEAKPNSVAVYSGYFDYGHVAFVVDVDDETMTVVENKASGEGKIEGKRSKGLGSGADGGIYLIGFIYVTEPKVSNNGGNTTVTTPKTKSGNSNLANLEIENYDIEFQKDKYYYYLVVPNEINNITIKGSSEDSKSYVDGMGNYDLLEGENLLSIKITAEDESSSIYNIVIKRNEKIEDKEEELEDEKEESNNQKSTNSQKNNWLSHYWIYILSGIILLGISIFLVIKLRKKSK